MNSHYWTWMKYKMIFMSCICPTSRAIYYILPSWGFIIKLFHNITFPLKCGTLDQIAVAAAAAAAAAYVKTRASINERYGQA